MNRPLLAGVELGGTKCVCILGSGPEAITATRTIPTGADPDATLGEIHRTLEAWSLEHGPFAALGVASFGPVDLNPASPRHGWITTTAKPGWRDVDLIGRLTPAFDGPVGFDTDVNGAAHAEGLWGAAVGLRNFAYVTVGTGVGVGLVVDGRSLQGFAHPEMGHIRVARLAGDVWPGACPFHGDCVEGLASGAALAQRIGYSPERLSADDPVWETVAHALAQLLHSLVVTTAPQRILFGGGVMLSQPHLFPRLREKLLESLGGYLDAPELLQNIETYIGPPGLGALAGPLGALALAARALQTRKARA